jgi:hypothetical protein
MHVVILTIKFLFALMILGILALLVPLYLGLAAPLFLARAMYNFFITANEQLRGLAVALGLVSGAVLVVRVLFAGQPGAPFSISNSVLAAAIFGPVLLHLLSIPWRRWLLRIAEDERKAKVDAIMSQPSVAQQAQQQIAEIDYLVKSGLYQQNGCDLDRAREAFHKRGKQSQNASLDELLEPRI